MSSSVLFSLNDFKAEKKNSFNKVQRLNKQQMKGKEEEEDWCVKIQSSFPHVQFLSLFREDNKAFKSPSV